jgi:hypothetical protein
VTVASDYGGDGDDPQPKRRIQDRLDRLQDIRDQFWSEGAGGSFSPSTKRYIATVVMQVWDVLYQYRDESVLSEGDFPDISPVRDRLGRQQEVVVDSPRLGEDHTVKTVPAVNELDDWYLIELSEQLDDLANTLGFGASATTSRPLYDAGKRDNYPDPVVEGIPKPQRGRGEGDMADLTYSKLYHDWYQRVACGDPNDYVIAVSADPRSTGVSGSGKTTLGGGLAKRWFDYSEDGFDAEVQYTLDAAQLAYEMYNETGELAVLVGDEMQGTPATTGLNAKRSQKSEALDAVNAIAAGRSDRKTVILIVQDLKSLNKDALTFIDAWLLIRDDYDYVATHYSVAPDVYDLGNRETKTPAVEQITWDALPKDDPDYQVMEEKKQQAKEGQREYSDGDGKDDDNTAMPKPARDAKIKRLYDQGIPQKKIAGAFDLTQQAVSAIVNGRG